MFDKEIMKIDKSRLDDECVTHSATLFEIHSALIKAQEKRDAAKIAVDEMYAEVDAKIRNNALIKGEKITEAKISNQIILDNDYKEVYTNYINAKLEADNLVAVKDSYIARGVMIRSLCELYVAGYFSDISVKGTKQTVTQAKYENGKKTLAAIKSKKEKMNG
jgi:hypothetical protein